MKKLVLAALAAVLSFGANAGALPSVGKGTEPNQWTSNVDGVIAAAQQTGYPILVVMINDTSTGEGCVHCWNFVLNTLNNSEFKRVVNQYKFYMVMINNGGLDGFTDYFVGQYYRFGGDYLGGTLPLVRVFSGDGSQGSDIWSQATCEGPNFWRVIEKAIVKYAPSDTVLSLEAVSASTSLRENEAWTGKVTRSGNTGVTGTVALALSGDNASAYTVTPASIAWDGSDGSKNFTVTRTTESEGIVSDKVTVTLSATGFDGSTIKYGTKTIDLMFKDSRVGKTLSEFAAAHKGLDSLYTSDGSVWFVPATADGNVLETVTTGGEASLVWKATSGGVLTLTANGGDVSVAGSVSSFTLADGAQTTIGVTKGNAITFTVGKEGTAGTYGFSQFAFSPLTVTLANPESDAQISYADLLVDSAITDFSWSASRAGATYEVYGSQASEAAVFSGTKFYEGTYTSVNGIEAGFIKTDAAMGKCYWGVKATDSSAAHGKAVATATAAFTISALAVFPEDLPTTVTAYLKAGHTFDYSAETTSSDVTYSAKGLPTGMKINATTGEITGTPKKAGKYKVTIIASNAYGTSTASVALTAAKIPASVKASYNGVLFDSASAMVGSVTLKITAMGKWTGIVTVGKTKTKVSGTICFDETGTMSLESTALPLSFIGSTGVLTGKWKGSTVYAKKVDKKAISAFAGLWNGGVAASNEDTYSAYISAKVAATGKVTVNGKLFATTRISASGTILCLDANFVAKYLPKWAKGPNAAFSYAYKSASGRSFDGGVALYGNGAFSGAFKINGTACDVPVGSKWTGSSLDKLAGKTFKTTDGVSFDVAVSGTHISADTATAVSATKVKLTAVKKSGIFKGSFTNSSGGKCKYEGALFTSGSNIYGVGAGSIGKTATFGAAIE